MKKPPSLVKKIGLLSALLFTGLVQALLITWVIPSNNFDNSASQEAQQSEIVD